jgi:hypothetical protein
LILLGVGLILWIGPRPVYEPWAAEELTDSRLEELLLAGVVFARSGPGSDAFLRALAEANGIPATRLPDLADGAQLFDADNDGDLDLFTPGQSARGQPLLFFLNDGNGYFREVGRLLGPAFAEPRLDPSSGSERNSLCVDLDRDGKLDLVVPRDRGSWLALWNRLAERRFLRLLLLPAEAPLGESTGLARVELTAGGRRQVQLVRLDKASGGSPRWAAHFGLGDLAPIEQVVVRWPSGEENWLGDLEANREYQISEDVAGNSSPQKEKT